MNVDSPLESIKSDIAIEFENQKQAKIIYESIILEFETAPDYRLELMQKILLLLELLLTLQLNGLSCL